MKPTREEMVAIFRQVTDEEPLVGGWPVLERFALAIYRKGQEDMRERAEAAIHRLPLPTWLNLPQSTAEEILRALPIEGEE